MNPGERIIEKSLLKINVVNINDGIDTVKMKLVDIVALTGQINSE